MNRRILSTVVFVLLATLSVYVRSADAPNGKAIYDEECALCHNKGKPKIGDTTEWEARFKGGLAPLYASVIEGKGKMDPRGGNEDLTDAQIRASVDYLVLQSGGADLVKAYAAAAPAAAPSTLPAHGGAVEAPNGKAIYDEECGLCHNKSKPKIGDTTAWEARFKGGLAPLYASVIEGKGKMDPRGGNEDLTDAQIRASVDYLVLQSGGADLVKAYAAAAPAAAPANANVKTSASPGIPATRAVAVTPTAAVTAAATGANAFNRLMRSPVKHNLPPAEDGIHDRDNEGTLTLQAPLIAFAELPKSNAGNRVDWVKAFDQNHISPRSDRLDTKVKLKKVDTQIVREIKGSMGDVVFPHKEHVQWLACANCHPAIFATEIGVTKMSMATIMRGEQCGVCHGTVAFPVSECRRCHSRNKPPQATASSTP